MQFRILGPLEAFAQPEAARLEERRTVAFEDRLEAELAVGNPGAVAAELEMAVRERPLRERRWSLLMLALYRSERQGEALLGFNRARAILRDELGIHPGPILRRLHEDILDQSPSLDPWVGSTSPTWPLARPQALPSS